MEHVQNCFGHVEVNENFVSLERRYLSTVHLSVTVGNLSSGLQPSISECTTVCTLRNILVIRTLHCPHSLYIRLLDYESTNTVSYYQLIVSCIRLPKGHTFMRVALMYQNQCRSFFFGWGVTVVLTQILDKLISSPLEC